MGKLIAAVGVVVVLVGVIVWLLESAGVRPGSLPGDIVVRRGNFSLYFPIVTSIVLSVVLSLILNLMFGSRR